MGWFVQPLGHVQLITGMLDEHLNPQSALDRPRWKWTQGKVIEVEPHFSDDLFQALDRAGHQISKQTQSISFGRGQIILRHPEIGVLCGGTEPRMESAVLAW
jgi:gamma-glutamyltranspeptidase/glutathione hydrolase